MTITGSQGKLAIDGGSPARERMLAYGHQVISEKDIEAVVAVLRSDWLTTGPIVGSFEREFAALCGSPEAVAVSSGTAALHAAAVAAGIGPGDEVIVPALTFAASANCVLYVGGSPVFVDVRDDTLTIDPDGIAAAVTPRTRAIVTVDYAGQPADLDEIMDIARRHSLVVIDDAAHAVGARYRGRPIGSIADLTAFSFHPVKQMTTGEGGIVTTRDHQVAEAIRRFRNHGISTDVQARATAGTWCYEMSTLGYNYRLTDIQCALGRSQLAHLPEMLARRRAIAARYDAAFATEPAIRPTVMLRDRASSWHLYTVRLREERLRAGRREIFSALRAENIGVNVHYIPVPWHPYYAARGYRRGSWPVAESAYERLLTLPLWPGMSDDDVEDVITAVTKVCSAYRAGGAPS